MYDNGAEETYTPPTKDAIIRTALAHVGERSIRYVNGHPELGQSPDGFDCSGFARFVLTRAGFIVPDFIGMDGVRRPVRHTNEFWDHYGIAVHEPEGGDLVMFSRDGMRPTHIGIMLDEEAYVHAPGTDGSRVAVRALARTLIAPKGAGRQAYVRNPIGFKAPVVTVAEPTYRHHQSPA